MGWQSIQKAPKDGSIQVVGWSKTGHWTTLKWKHNYRIEQSKVKKPHDTPPEWLRVEIEKIERSHEDYWGDPDEYDDYELADPTNFPDLWHPIDAIPKP